MTVFGRSTWKISQNARGKPLQPRFQMLEYTHEKRMRFKRNAKNSQNGFLTIASANVRMSRVQQGVSKCSNCEF